RASQLVSAHLDRYVPDVLVFGRNIHGLLVALRVVQHRGEKARTVQAAGDTALRDATADRPADLQSELVPVAAEIAAGIAVIRIDLEFVAVAGAAQGL